MNTGYPRVSRPGKPKCVLASSRRNGTTSTRNYGPQAPSPRSKRLQGADNAVLPGCFFARYNKRPHGNKTISRYHPGIQRGRGGKSTVRAWTEKIWSDTLNVLRDNDHEYANTSARIIHPGIIFPLLVGHVARHELSCPKTVAA